METATLTSTPRPVMVQPVQKSLSLPSYARASGEGIDHKLIFAALEQREKIRRKSKIFKDKEKTGTTRQNYFCLPLPSSAKCKETSLSSDTSCSSLEFQKPKYRNSPRTERKDFNCAQNRVNENALLAPAFSAITKIDLNNNSDEGNRVPISVIIDKECSEKERNTRISRSTIGSSDSMERTEKSSKSSNDSLSRKERLVAIKARVEAERERTLCRSSSEEEEEEVSLRITRHNSDGVIHRTVREVKAKSTRTDKRIKRRNLEDSTAKRAARKQHKSLCIPSTIDLESWKPPIVRCGSSFSLQRELDNINNDFFGFGPQQNHASPQSVLNNNYYSDICSGSYKSRFVKPIVAKIEAKEQNLLEKNGPPKGRALSHFRNRNSPVDTRLLDESLYLQFDFNSTKKQPARPEKPPELIKQCFIPNSRAPTPPPRSPKSTEFVNKAIIQHQYTANYYSEACSLERKKTAHFSKLSSDDNAGQSNSVENIKKDLFHSRRKTCSNFPQVEEYIKERPKTPTFPYQTKISQQFPPRSPDLAPRLSGVARKSKLTEISNIKMISKSESQGRRWGKLEVDSEKKFNSLENRSSPIEVNIGRWKFPHNLSSGMEKDQERDCNNDDQRRIDNRKMESPNSIWNEVPLSPTEKTMKVETTRAMELNNPSPKMRCRQKNLQSKDEEKESYADIEYLSRQDATEDLNSAMKELECVYRSLRMSSENLSVKDTTESVPKVASKIEDRPLFKNQPEGVNSTNDTIAKLTSNERHLQNYSSRSTSSPTPNTTETSLNDERSITDALCIEELFGDLTEQLDLEQKLLQQNRKKPPNSPTPKNTNKQRLESPHGAVSPNSIGAMVDEPISIKHFSDKELLETTAISNIKQKVLATKKHKAVRSLSENIASLMTNGKRDADASYGKMNTLANKPDKGSDFPNNKTTKPLDNDAIWQIRVSMDPGKPPAEPPLPPSKDAASQLRLHTALRRPNNLQRGESPEASQSAHNKTTARLSENDLEQLLSTLLNDVSSKPITNRILSSPQENELNETDVTSKGVCGYERKWFLAHSMEPMINSAVGTKNGKSIKLLPAASNSPSNGKIDNFNTNQNNNETSGVHCSSFIPVRIRSSPRSPNFKMADNNDRSILLQRSSALLENNGNPRTSWLSGRGMVRRHSVGLDDFSDLSIYGGNRNSNQERRLPTVSPLENKRCSSDTASNCQCAANPVEAQSQSENHNAELDVKSPCNGSPKAFATVNFNRAGSYEKLKDKSFVRKSSLNRLEFVDQAGLNAARCSPSRRHNTQDRPQSSSEAGSDQDQKQSAAGGSSPLGIKRKITSGRRSEKELPTLALHRQDAVQSNTDPCDKKMHWLFNSKYRDNSLKIRSKKNSKALMSQFKKKAFSAGEHDSSNDNSKINDQSKICFSSQETRSKGLSSASTSSILMCSNEQNIDDPKPMNCEELNEQTLIVSNCDISSRNSEVEVLPKTENLVKAATANCDAIPDPKDENCTDLVDEGAQEIHSIEMLQIDKDLFNSSDTASITPLRPFPVEEFVSSSLGVNNEGCDFHCNEQGQARIEMEHEPRDLSPEPMEFQVSRSSTPVDSDKESSRHPNSILRRKLFQNRKERHGILKNAEDKLGSRQFPSILKHRESSEEKDNWIQSDLHSILKKSTSEDESSTNSPDIRPILKNTSTDDESSGLSSKPKPILKKRTSFSEECSYACFHGSELKPILKKKSISDLSEEQPKPILKTRRKSEEAAATTMEFPFGARPRAYSADRGVCKAAKEDDNPT